MKSQFAIVLLVIAMFCACAVIFPFCASAQCGDCDDKNPCTRDYCNGTQCLHEPTTCSDVRQSKEPSFGGDGIANTPESTDNSNPPVETSYGTSGNNPEPENCDDGDPCTADYYGANGCVHEPIDCGNDRTSPPAAISPSITNPPEIVNPPEITNPAATNSSEITSPAAASPPATAHPQSVISPETAILQAINSTQANIGGIEVSGFPMNSSESGKSWTHLNSNVPEITMILENDAASNISSIDGLAEAIEFEESMQTEENSSILQDSEIFMNDTNESIIGNVSAALLHFCDDGNPCTTDKWNGNRCVYTPANCDDSDPCTVDSCENGVCTHKQKDCDDQNESTIDYCLNGACVHSLKECDDGNACTIDTWNGHECVRTPGDCDDGNPCTADSCENGACTHKQKNCNDGNPCTTDSCVNGKCTHKQKSCEDGNACTIDACDGRGNCVHLWRNCDDGNPCTIDECDPYWGCTHTPVVCGGGRRCVNGVCQAVSSPGASPSSYTIPPGSSINLPWGTAVTAIGSAKVESAVAYAAGQPLRFSRPFGYDQAASTAQGINQVAESAEMVGLSWQSSPFSVTLIEPDGSILSPDSDRQNIKHVTGTNYDYYFLRNPAKGIWNIEIRPINPDSRGEGFSLITGLVSGAAFNR